MVVLMVTEAAHKVQYRWWWGGRCKRGKARLVYSAADMQRGCVYAVRSLFREREGMAEPTKNPHAIRSVRVFAFCCN